ncbi:MAG: hypothetical protein LAT63_17185 [Marinobacter sp.]|nr:hypothetical protein [Marinobacter sp.]
MLQALLSLYLATSDRRNKATADWPSDTGSGCQWRPPSCNKHQSAAADCH